MRTQRRLWLRVVVNRAVATAAVVGALTALALLASRLWWPVDVGWVLVGGGVIGVGIVTVWMRRAPVRDDEAVRLLDLHLAADERLATLRDSADRSTNQFVPLLAADAERFAERVARRDVRLHTFWWDRPALLLVVLALAVAHGALLALAPASTAHEQQQAAATAAATREAAELDAAIERARELGHDDVADALTDLQRQILGTAGPDEMQRAMARLQREARELRERQARQAELQEWTKRAEELSQSDTATMADATSLAERARELADRLGDRDAASAAALREAADALDGGGATGDELDVEALASALARLREEMRDFAADEAFVQAMSVKVEALGDRVASDLDHADTARAVNAAAATDNDTGSGEGSVSRANDNAADTSAGTGDALPRSTVRLQFRPTDPGDTGHDGDIATRPPAQPRATTGTSALAVRFAEAMAAERADASETQD